MSIGIGIGCDVGAVGVGWSTATCSFVLLELVRPQDLAVPVGSEGVATGLPHIQHWTDTLSVNQIVQQLLRVDFDYTTALPPTNSIPRLVKLHPSCFKFAAPWTIEFEIISRRHSLEPVLLYIL